jgi:hypothetical protein
MDLHEIEKSRNDRDNFVGGNLREDERLRDLVENVERQRERKPELHCRMLRKGALEPGRVPSTCLDGSLGDRVGTA